MVGLKFCCIRITSALGPWVVTVSCESNIKHISSVCHGKGIRLFVGASHGDGRKDLVSKVLM